MTDGRAVTICVDAVGGDDAPGVVLDGITKALDRDEGITVVVAGPASIVSPFCDSRTDGRAVPLIAEDVIEMGAHAAQSIRTKRDSSIVRGCQALKDGDVDAFFSAGSTGACMAAATLVTGRIKGVRRPAIATVLPTSGPPCVLVDVGANADCKPEDLVQFARMGAAYAQIILDVAEPRIGLLNIGEEPSKGSQLAIEAHALLRESVAGFVGNVEGRDVLAGSHDVIVTDGFTGNVALKLLEGTSSELFSQLKKTMLSSLRGRIGAILASPGLRALKARLDPDTYGGAPLLGVSGVCIIGHGSSSATAIANAISVSARAARGGLTQAIAQAITSDSKAKTP